jgi:hypothetical protein
VLEKEKHNCNSNFCNFKILNAETTYLEIPSSRRLDAEEAEEAGYSACLRNDREYSDVCA